MVARVLLANSNPELRQQYEVDLNVGISFDELYVTFPKKVFWMCSSGHLIHQKPRGRIQGRCLPCALDRNRKFLVDHHPKLVSEFDSTLNENVNPQRLYSRSPGNYWWKCRQSSHLHSYLATVGTRIKGRRCQFCAGIKILPGYNDWASIYPLQSLSWDHEANVDGDGNIIDPSTLGVENREQRSWICLEGNHARTISISAAIRGEKTGKRCRTCSGYKSIPGESDAPSLFPELLERLDTSQHDKQSLEGIHPGNRDIEFNWICIEGHSWKRSVAEEIRGKGCNKCLGREVWVGHTDLSSQYPEIAKEYCLELNLSDDTALDLPPDQVHVGSNSYSWWRCLEHRHEWKTTVQRRTLENTGCPFCSDRRVWPGYNDLATKRPDLVDEIDFDKHPELNPSQVLWVSHDYLNWVCEHDHPWPAQIYMRTKPGKSQRPTGCPSCADYGFDPSKSAELYLIRSKDLGALKVGITNTGTSRISRWIAQGWDVIERKSFKMGSQARLVEKAFHRWRRFVCEVPDFLEPKDVGTIGGWTETFSEAALGVTECRLKLDSLVKTQLKVSDESSSG